MKPLILALQFGDLPQATDHACVDRTFGEVTLVIRHSGFLPGQQTHCLIDLTDRIDVEQTGFHRIKHTLVQHEIGHVGPWNDGALFAGQTAGETEPEEPFDLLVDTAHRLHLAKLVDRAGDGEALLEWRA